MVRGLALDQVSTEDWLKVLWKELRIAAVVGALLGVVNAARILLMYGAFGGGAYEHVGAYALVVSVALFGAVVLAKVVGGMLPLGVKRFGLDPALMASPFIATIVDTCSLLLYFRIAMAVFARYM